MNGRVTGSRRRLIRDACLLILSISWLSSGLFKFTDLDGFTQILQAHDVLPENAVRGAILVPLMEVLVGALLGWRLAGNPRRFGGAELISLVGMLILAAYVAVLPASTVAEIGCGCGGIAAVSTAMPWSEKVSHLILIAVLILAHGPLIPPVPSRADRAGVGGTDADGPREDGRA